MQQVFAVDDMKGWIVQSFRNYPQLEWFMLLGCPGRPVREVAEPRCRTPRSFDFDAALATAEVVPVAFRHTPGLFASLFTENPLRVLDCCQLNSRFRHSRTSRCFFGPVPLAPAHQRALEGL